jgi:membrane-associated phospholipid phosphatase
VTLVAVLGAAVGANDRVPLDVAVDELAPVVAEPAATTLLGSLARDIGGEKGAAAIAVAAGIVVWLRRRDWLTGFSLLAAYTGAWATAELLKYGVGRRGPNAVDPTSPGFSFPSAHTARAFAVLGLLIALTALLESRKVAIVLGAGASLAIAALMLAQLAVGHHWLTDQLGGIAVGLGWVFLLLPGPAVLWQLPRSDSDRLWAKPERRRVEAYFLLSGPSHVRAATQSPLSGYYRAEFADSVRGRRLSRYLTERGRAEMLDRIDHGQREFSEDEVADMTVEADLGELEARYEAEAGEGG